MNEEHFFGGKATKKHTNKVIGCGQHLFTLFQMLDIFV
jgi:hypothetical protein